jgi:glycosyltransferase involved in cell wall biosynthesis
MSPESGPLVSIIVPAYNQARWIRDTLESVIAQTYDNWECIVVNDGSTDATAEIVRSLAQSDERIRLIEQANRGVSSARNVGIDASAGKYVVFLDGDDLLLPEKLRRQVTALEQTGGDLHVSAIRVAWSRDSQYPETGTVWGPPPTLQNLFRQFLAEWEVGFVLPLMGFMVRRTTITEAGARWDSSLYSHEDWDFWLQVAHAQPKTLCNPEPTAIYRVHGHGATASRYRCWKGYLGSLEIQRHRYRDEAGAEELLAEHYRRMHLAYRSSFPFRRWLIDQLVEKPWFRNSCPWPLQRPLRKYCGV